jgi:hypothetical protein
MSQLNVNGGTSWGAVVSTKRPSGSVVALILNQRSAKAQCQTMMSP